MRHKETKAVFGIWDSLKQGANVPARASIQPRAFARHLSQICLLDKAGPDATIRLSGTDICGLFGRELRGAQFGGLFLHGAHLSIQAALARCLTLGKPMVVETLAETADNRQIGVELILLPLSDSQGLTSQILAFLQPLDPVARLGVQCIAGFRLLGMTEAKVSDAPTDSSGSGPARPLQGAPQRAQLRLVVSNAIVSAFARHLRAPRSDAALGLVSTTA